MVSLPCRTFGPGPCRAWNDRAGRDAAGFAGEWQGRLAELAATPEGGEALGRAVEEYEALSDLLGRIGSYAMLYYVGDTTDPDRSKFYGDTQSKLTDLSLQAFVHLEPPPELFQVDL